MDTIQITIQISILTVLRNKAYGEVVTLSFMFISPVFISFIVVNNGQHNPNHIRSRLWAPAKSLAMLLNDGHSL